MTLTMGIISKLQKVFRPEKSAIEFKKLESSLSYSFQNTVLLKRALTHSSVVEKHPSQFYSYERLEFLGDAVLELVISDFLYSRFPEDAEGELTRKRASIVNKLTLAEIAQKIQLSEYIKTQVVPSNPIEQSESVLSDVFEAIIGAIYKDGGFNAVRNTIYKLIPLQEIENDEEFPMRNFKGELIEYCHTKNLPIPQFQTLEKSGPEHSRLYKIAVMIGNKKYGEGKGPSKKKAGKKAAQIALEKLMNEESNL